MPIQQCNSTQLSVIKHLAYQIWPATYENIISDSQIQYMLNWMYSLPSLLQQFHTGHIFLLAINDLHEPVGFSSYSKTTPNTFHLHKLYVLPQEQKKGWGKQLLEYILSEIEKCNGISITLNVNRNNPATEFYKKNGFRIEAEVNNNIGNGFFMNDYVMKKNTCKIEFTKPIGDAP